MLRIETPSFGTWVPATRFGRALRPARFFLGCSVGIFTRFFWQWRFRFLCGQLIPAFRFSKIPYLRFGDAVRRAGHKNAGGCFPPTPFSREMCCKARYSAMSLAGVQHRHRARAACGLSGPRRPVIGHFCFFRAPIFAPIRRLSDRNAVLLRISRLSPDGYEPLSSYFTLNYCVFNGFLTHRSPTHRSVLRLPRRNRGLISDKAAAIGAWDA